MSLESRRASMQGGFSISRPEFIIEVKDTLQSLAYEEPSLSVARAYDPDKNEISDQPLLLSAVVRRGIAAKY